MVSVKITDGFMCLFVIITCILYYYSERTYFDYEIVMNESGVVVVFCHRNSWNEKKTFNNANQNLFTPTVAFFAFKSKIRYFLENFTNLGKLNSKYFFWIQIMRKM